jgi:hypothetical protein
MLCAASGKFVIMAPDMPIRLLATLAEFAVRRRLLDVTVTAQEELMFAPGGSTSAAVLVDGRQSVRCPARQVDRKRDEENKGKGGPPNASHSLPPECR